MRSADIVRSDDAHQSVSAIRRLRSSRNSFNGSALFKLVNSLSTKAQVIPLSCQTLGSLSKIADRFRQHQLQDEKMHQKIVRL